MDRYWWLVFVALAGLSWGTYVPLIFYGGQQLPAQPGGPLGGRLMAILCVGVAYFVLAVMIPLGLFFSGQQSWPEMKTTGLVFSSLAGLAGAVGAICVVFAVKSALDAAKATGQEPATYRVYIAPLIFGLAPVINTLISLVWTPTKDDPFHFGMEHAPSWKLLLGIVLVGAGAFLVLFSKEEAEAAPKSKPATTATGPAPTAPPAGEPAPSSNPH